ncbi:SAM-dependent methyltransferase [Saccharopolyspora erythraea]|uniref:methyltransferase n=1 Tax=Saccharopolyspora erythraea TaxID=1836 RepID=UPI001BA48832|nr:methyltransferase [Saccharopolyspora erythraea]QUH03576.1 SAM-dependent methyltransferase [Saccharopolyspora erythraea]
MTANAELNHIQELALGFMSARAVHTAVELGVFPLLAQGPLTAEELREQLGLHGRGARDFFNCLVALGLLEYADERYAATAATSRYLGDPGAGTYVGGMLEYMGSHWYWSWGRLADALRTGRSQSYGGQVPYEAIHSDPGLSEEFQRAMSGGSVAASTALAGSFPWQDVATVADIGCSDGSVLSRLLLAHPHLTGVGFDLPMVEHGFDKTSARHGLADRMRFTPGDFRTASFPAADAVVFGHLLIDWDLATRRMLLAKAYDALPEGGTILIYDMLVEEDQRESAPGLLISLHMLVDQGGGVSYTAAECFGWLADAGFRQCRVRPLSGADQLITAVK